MLYLIFSSTGSGRSIVRTMITRALVVWLMLSVIPLAWAAPPKTKSAPKAPEASTGSKAPEPSLMEMMWENGGSIPAWVGQSKTEPFDVREFLVSREAPADNAAPLYFQAMAVFGVEMYSASGAPS